MEILPPYIRDSKHFLQLLESFPPLPENAILVTADVPALYRNIPPDEGIEFVLHYLKLHANILPPGTPSPHTIGVLLETILKNNNLSFMDRHFLQLVGTAMGTKAAPPNSNLFMDRHKETTREAFIWAIPFWKRFIDVIFMIFLGTTKQLQSTNDFMNNLNPTIKFTFEHSTQEIPFLDIKIHIKQAANSQQPCAENSLAVLPFYASTPTTHSNAKKALFSHRLLDTTSSLQMTIYYKKNSISLQCLSLPENTL